MTQSGQQIALSCYFADKSLLKLDGAPYGGHVCTEARRVINAANGPALHRTRALPVLNPCWGALVRLSRAAKGAQTPSQYSERDEPSLQIKSVLRSPSEFRTVGSSRIAKRRLCGVVVKLNAFARHASGHLSGFGKP